MPHWIERVVEPSRLLLAWQGADLSGDRYRWAVGEITAQGNSHQFRYFVDGPEFAALNDDKPFAALEAAGYAGYPAFNRSRGPFDLDVMTAFRRRLPAKERSDYADYLEHFRLKPDVWVSDFTLLGLTGAKLPSDGFSIVDPLDDTRPGRDIFLEVAGHRHYPRTPPLVGGEAVTFAAEPDNAKDPNAIVIRVGRNVIGYVNRLHTQAFRAWVAEGRLCGFVERLNGRPGHPRAFVFVRVEPQAERAAA